MMEMKIKKDKKPKNPNLIKISASSTKTYSQCQLRYRYQYLDHAERKEFDHFTLGNICHKALEIFHKEYKNGDNLPQLMTQSFKKVRKMKGYKNTKKELLLEAKSLLDDYLVAVSTDMPNVKSVEKSFSIKLNKDLTVRGFLDRVDILESGRFHIADYKTTKNTKYLDTFQLLTYGLWLMEEYPKVDIFDASYILLRHQSKLQTYTFNKKDIEGCRKKLIEYGDNIRNSIKNNQWPANPNVLCQWCDFREICSVYKEW